jgi:GTP-binding protein Era
LKKDIVLMIIDDISKKFKFDEIIPLSSKTGFNVDDFIKTTVRYLPEHEFYFEGDIVASQPEKFFVAEIIRAQVLKLYREEIPFSAYIEIDEFKERERGKDYIRAGIILEKDSQKPIVIGKRGAMIKLLGVRARKDIEEFLGHEVFLELFVKISKNWKNDEKFLRRNFIKSTVSAI